VGGWLAGWLAGWLGGLGWFGWWGVPVCRVCPRVCLFVSSLPCSRKLFDLEPRTLRVELSVDSPTSNLRNKTTKMRHQLRKLQKQKTRQQRERQQKQKQIHKSIQKRPTGFGPI
jgi:hypothetical protein